MSERSEGQPEGSEGLSEGSKGLPEGSKCLPEGSEGQPVRPGGLLEGSMGLPGGLGGDRWMYVRMDGCNFSPIYRTLSPVGAATQKELTKSFKNINLVISALISCFHPVSFGENVNTDTCLVFRRTLKEIFSFFKEFEYRYVHSLAVIKHG